MENKKVYLSLPISGYDLQERIETAKEMETRLCERGYDVFNPLGEQWVKGLTYYDYMKLDLKALLDCDTVLFMNGWNKSAGCHTELCVSVACGLDVWFQDLENVKL